MLRPQVWLITLGLITLLGIRNASADIAQSQETLPFAVIPSLESSERPSGAYHPGQDIPYRIRIHWSSTTEEIRMRPPDLNLQNLELSGVSQETVSQPERSEATGEHEQILTFHFKAQKPGPAKVDGFSLRWIQGDGTATSDLAIPPLELRITPSPKLRIQSLAIGGGLLLLTGTAISFLIRVLRKTKKQGAIKAPTKPLEEAVLDELHKVRTTWETNTSQKELLGELTHVLQSYCHQKLDWNPSHQGGYNDLQKKAEVKWSKKEARELTELFRLLEYERFSGAQTDREKLLACYQTLCSFVERRRVI